jgi:hypothetical protein
MLTNPSVAERQALELARLEQLKKRALLLELAADFRRRNC